MKNETKVTFSNHVPSNEYIFSDFVLKNMELIITQILPKYKTFKIFTVSSTQLFKF